MIISKRNRPNEVDPLLETADTDRYNNFWPPKTIESRFQLQKRKKSKILCKKPKKRRKKKKTKKHLILVNKIRRLLPIFWLSLWGIQTSNGHPVHATFAEAQWNHKTTEIEVSLRLRGMDLESAHRKRPERKSI